MAITYPATSFADVLTPAEVHLLLANPTLIARRVSELAKDRFIADFLLQGRFDAKGGVVLYEENFIPEADRDPESIAPNGEYPLTTMTAPEVESAKVKKWGEDGIVTDESIARNANRPLDTKLLGIVNKLVRWIDGIAMSVISSKVTQTYDASATPWSDGANILKSILTAQATAVEATEGQYDYNTVVLSPMQQAAATIYVAGSRVAAGQAIGGVDLFRDLGFEYVVQSPSVTTPMLVDRDRLGGMADENLGGPGYQKHNGMLIETKVIRLDETDSYRPRARRVTVPVVTDPLAAIKLTGV